MTNRREFATWAILAAVFARPAFAAKVKPIANRFARDLHVVCGDLRNAKIPPREWQDAIEKLFGTIPLEDLLAAVDFETLAALPDLGVTTTDPPIPKVEGLGDAPYVLRLFGMEKGRAIIPHGHRNMVSMHVVLRGEFRLRHFERVRDEDGHMIIRPTIDATSKPGDRSTISDERNNVHWLIAQNGPGYTLDVIVANLYRKATIIQNIDIAAATKLEPDLLRAPYLDVKTALAKYGKS